MSELSGITTALNSSLEHSNYPICNDSIIYNLRLYRNLGSIDRELFQLRYFLTVTKYENFSKAADELHISQPSVSKAVKQLEMELALRCLRGRARR